jgi:hypothetical protein
MLEKGQPRPPLSQYLPSRALDPTTDMEPEAWATEPAYRPVGVPTPPTPVPVPRTVVEDVVDLQRGVVRFKGMYVHLSPAELQSIKRTVVSALQAQLEAEVGDGEESPPAAD